MNHATIQEKSLIERYHQGRLRPEEEAEFEEHFTSCPECQEELEMARGFRMGMRSMAAQEAARQTVAAGIFAWLAQLSRGAQAGYVAAALLLAAALPTAWFLLNTQHLRATAETARTTLAEWQERYENERQTTARLEEQLAEGERIAGEERSKLTAELEQVTANSEQQAAQLESFKKPIINTPVFILSTLRGEGDAALTLDLREVGEWLALAVDVDDDPRIENYRATVFDAGGDRVWRKGGLLPNNLETLMITFPASFFSAGTYRLSVEGRVTSGDHVEIESYSFRVVGQ